MPLRLDGLRKSFGTYIAVKDVQLDVPAGAIISLIGPSGCGKTTTLRMIAGLERPDVGRIIAGGRLLADGARGLPPEQRDLGMVFQSYALWPHMSVADNVAYGLRRRKWPAATVGPKVAEVLEVVRMSGLGDRFPGQLSGGQQQRVALARAIAPEPAILLFDEPLSNLDAVLREEMRFEIRELQQRLGITSIYVTHSQDEAMAISDAIAVMQGGAVVQTGDPLSIYNNPRNAFVAGFIGLANILQVTVREWQPGQIMCVLGDGSPLTIAAPRVMPMRDGIALCIRPIDLRVVPGKTATTEANNAITATVVAIAFTGGLVDLFVALADGSRLRMQLPPPVTLAPGARVQLTVAPDRIAVLDA